MLNVFWIWCSSRILKKTVEVLEGLAVNPAGVPHKLVTEASCTSSLASPWWWTWSDLSFLSVFLCWLHDACSCLRSIPGVEKIITSLLDIIKPMNAQRIQSMDTNTLPFYLNISSSPDYFIILNQIYLISFSDPTKLQKKWRQGFLRISAKQRLLWY